MKYVSRDSTIPMASSNNGFWVRDDQIFDVTNSSHVRFIIDNPFLFNLTGKQILDVYKKHREVVGTESKARAELVRYAASLGWCRVRHYTRPKEYWSIQTDSTKARKETVVAFIRWGIENGIVHKNDSAVIIGFANSRDRHEYLYQDGGIANFLSEELPDDD
ncbi:MAG: hypothetical protein ABSG17_06340 [Spirochaetia bacterium]